MGTKLTKVGIEQRPFKKNVLIQQIDSWTPRQRFSVPVNLMGSPHLHKWHLKAICPMEQTMHFFPHLHLLINSTTICQVHGIPDPEIRAKDTEIHRQDTSQYSGSSSVIVMRVYRGGRSWPCDMGAEGKRGIEKSFSGEVLNIQEWVMSGLTNRKLVGKRSPGRGIACANIYRQERVRGIPGTKRSQNDCGTEPGRE